MNNSGTDTPISEYYDKVSGSYDTDFGSLLADSQAAYIKQITCHMTSKDPVIVDCAVGTGNAMIALQKHYNNYHQYRLVLQLKPYLLIQFS